MFGLTRGLQYPFSCVPLACTSAPSFGLRGRLVATRVAKATGLFCSNFLSCMKVSRVGLPMNKSRSLEMNVKVSIRRSTSFFIFNKM